MTDGDDLRPLSLTRDIRVCCPACSWIRPPRGRIENFRVRGWGVVLFVALNCERGPEIQVIRSGLGQEGKKAADSRAGSVLVRQI